MCEEKVEIILSKLADNQLVKNCGIEIKKDGTFCKGEFNFRIEQHFEDLLSFIIEKNNGKRFRDRFMEIGFSNNEIITMKIGGNSKTIKIDEIATSTIVEDFFIELVNRYFSEQS